MFISVVICTRNRAESLRQTLNSLFSCTNLAQPDWGVLVVENVETSTDSTADVCRSFQKKFPQHFRFLTEKRLGKSHALNRAIATAQANILAFTDDDVICAPDYIVQVRNVFTTYSPDAVQGRVLLDCEGGWPAWLDKKDLAVMANLQDFGDEIIELKGTLCGTNMIVRADVFAKSGGFATELGPAGVGMWEDTEISLRIRRAGCRMIYAPQILVRHQWQKGRLTKAFLRSRFFGQGRAIAYYDPLPVSLSRFGVYVVKEMIMGEIAALWYLCTGRPAQALRSQCAARGHAGFWWQHWLFKRGLPRKLSVGVTAIPKTET
jgi:glucosyl-dolichyl phosphate glucuronosyltransferase